MQKNSVQLKERTKFNLSYDFIEQNYSYQVLNTLEFNSNRKRMSVIVRDKITNEIQLFCKGADSILIGLLEKDQDESDLKQNLDHFAKEGLRTLAVAFRRIEESEYQEFLKIYQEAERSLENREDKVINLI